MNLDTPCIEWLGQRKFDGYGVIRFRSGGRQRNMTASRFLWKTVKGDIPKGLFPLHGCDNPPCINLDHLYLGTHQQNMDDMKRRGRHRSGNTIKTHCKRGHPLTGENLVLRLGGRQRACRICQNMLQARWRSNHK